MPMVIPTDSRTHPADLAHVRSVLKDSLLTPGDPHTEQLWEEYRGELLHIGAEFLRDKYDNANINTAAYGRAMSVVVHICDNSECKEFGGYIYRYNLAQPWFDCETCQEPMVRWVADWPWDMLLRSSRPIYTCSVEGCDQISIWFAKGNRAKYGHLCKQHPPVLVGDASNYYELG